MFPVPTMFRLADLANAQDQAIVRSLPLRCRMPDYLVANSPAWALKFSRAKFLAAFAVLKISSCNSEVTIG